LEGQYRYLDGIDGNKKLVEIFFVIIKIKLEKLEFYKIDLWASPLVLMVWD
jgi:hypothetical protein